MQSANPSRDLALREVGRTVVNFQRLEHNLKRAARLGMVRGALPAIQRDTARRQQRADSLTLGQAIQAWLKYCDGPGVEEAWTPDLFDVSVQITFTLESDAESRRAHAAALGALLQTRNDLVHTRLVSFPWDSTADCLGLVRELAAINDAISQQLEYLTSLMGQIVEAHREGAEALRAELGGTTAPMPGPPVGET